MVKILVVNDLLGLTDFPPRFAKAVDSIGDRIQAAGRQWVQNVHEGSIGAQAYTMRAGEKEKLDEGSKKIDLREPINQSKVY